MTHTGVFGLSVTAGFAGMSGDSNRSAEGRHEAIGIA